MPIQKVQLPDESVQDIHDARIAAIDTSLSGSSTNPVQNSAITSEFVKVTYIGDVDETVGEIPDEPEPEPIIIIGGDYANVNGDLTEEFSVKELEIYGVGTGNPSTVGSLLPNGTITLDSAKKLKLTYQRVVQQVGSQIPEEEDVVKTIAYTSDIPSAVTESTVSGWGFTKNAGTLTGVKFNNTDATVSNGVASITATIPTVPTISTNITSDATSDTKTASPKAVKTYVDNMCGNIESLLAAI